MKAACVIGMSNKAFAKDKDIINAVTSTLSELGVEVLTLSLMESGLTYYEEGRVSDSYAKIAAAAKEVKSLILAFSAVDYAPCAIMKAFLEHAANGRFFENKSIFLISIGEKGGEKEAADYVSRIVGLYGGIEIVRTAIGGDVYASVRSGEIPLEAVEKYAEDFYRLTKQNRIFLKVSERKDSLAPYLGKDNVRPDTAIHSSETMQAPPADSRGSLKEQRPANQPAEPFQMPLPDAYNDAKALKDLSALAFDNQSIEPPAQAQGADIPASKPEPLIDFSMFNAKQEEDIEALTKLFQTKLKSDSEQGDGFKMPNLLKQQPPYNPSPKNEPPFMGQGADTLKLTPDYVSQAKSLYEMPDAHAYGTYGAPPEFPQNPPQSGFGYAPPNPLTQQQGQAQGKKSLIRTADPYMESYMGQPPYPQQNAHQNPYYRSPQEGSQIVARVKTCKQMTQNLPHYFQAQLAQDTEAVFQFIISGDEPFSGYILIKDKDNEYYDGIYETPDITILADSSVWINVLKGKHTAQKAFMTGQLKVRGNFMLLNRFDQIYKKM